MNFADLIDLLPNTPAINIWDLLFLAAFLYALQLAANRLSQVNWRKAVKDEIELYRLLYELEKLSQDAPQSQALDTLKNRLEERVMGGALRKKKLMRALDSFPITCIGAPFILVSFIVLAYENEVYTDNWHYLAFAFLVGTVLFMFVDLLYYFIFRKVLPLLLERVVELFQKRK